MVGDGQGRRKTAGNNRKLRKMAEDGRGRWTVGDGPSLGCVGQVPEKTGRDDRMPSVLVFDSDLSGNFRKRPDGTTKCRPSSSSNPTCRATLENDRTGRQTAVRPCPGLGRTDCPVANTGCRGLEFSSPVGASPRGRDAEERQTLAANLSRSWVVKIRSIASLPGLRRKRCSRLSCKEAPAASAPTMSIVRIHIASLRISHCSICIFLVFSETAKRRTVLTCPMELVNHQLESPLKRLKDSETPHSMTRVGQSVL